jgi:Protein of unknown function (DUF3551)
MNRILLVIATAAAVLAFAVSAGDAAYIGNAPWCAVVNIGAGAVDWDCEYPSAQACAPNVVAGNRGFCGLNPYYSSVPPNGAAHIRRLRRSRHSQ